LSAKFRRLARRACPARRLTHAFACGVGFGVAEGIHYSVNSYNGWGSWELYAVRFLCVAGAHAVWTGITAIALHSFRVNRFGSAFLFACVPSALLHAGYNTANVYEMWVPAYVMLLAASGTLIALVEISRWRSLPVLGTAIGAGQRKAGLGGAFRDVIERLDPRRETQMISFVDLVGKFGSSERANQLIELEMSLDPEIERWEAITRAYQRNPTGEGTPDVR
jgi:hypothetical protein